MKKMFTYKDIECRSIFVINCIKDRNLRVSNGDLLLEEMEEKKTLTKLPFQKILALFVIGHIHITTPLLDKCRKYNVALVVVKPNFRPVFYWANAAEGNFLLRQRQYQFDKNDLSVAKVLIANKIENQLRLLSSTRKKDVTTENAKEICRSCLEHITTATEYSVLMGIEGWASKNFFSVYFNELGWMARRPRTKCDIPNVVLDIGYTILFNYIECFIRMFGFDLYIGVFHRLWFKRKSLVCDVMEPFRCIIEKTVRNAFNRHQFSAEDFVLQKGEYRLRIEKNQEYYKVFFDALILYKTEIFKYVRNYYRCFLQCKSVSQYPQFIL